MGANFLLWLADEFRAAGLEVVEWEGWRTRARRSGGYDDPKGPLCVMWHHTASNSKAENDVRYMANNAATRPIANAMPDRNGVVWLMAAGATNTNGPGRTCSFSRGVVPADGMNSRAFGMEIANDGVGGVYPTAQIDAAFIISNVVNKNCGNDSTDVMTHAIYAPVRKPDPAKATSVQGRWQPHGYGRPNTWVLDDLIAECARRANVSPPQPKPPEPQPEPRPPQPIPEDEVSTVVVLEDGRNGTWYRCGLEAKSWVQDGNMAAQLIMRIDETSKSGVAVDGIRYVKMKNGNRDYIRSTGPIVGPMPPGVDEYGG